MTTKEVEAFEEDMELDDLLDELDE